MAIVPEGFLRVLGFCVHLGEIFDSAVVKRHISNLSRLSMWSS